MKPYYQDKSCTIYHGDCREILPTLDKVDLVLTDPPYGKKISMIESFGKANKSNTQTYNISSWDNMPMPETTFLLCKEVSQNQIIFGFNYLCNFLPPTSAIIVWDKKLKNNWEDTFADCEIIWTSFNHPPRVYRHLWHGACRASETNKGDYKKHPTQKPLVVITWLLNKYLKEKEAVLDPYLGSGTTLRAAKDLGRKAIGIEIEEKYCEISARRLEQESLFSV